MQTVGVYAPYGRETLLHATELVMHLKVDTSCILKPFYSVFNFLSKFQLSISFNLLTAVYMQIQACSRHHLYSSLSDYHHHPGEATCNGDVGRGALPIFRPIYVVRDRDDDGVWRTYCCGGGLHEDSLVSAAPTEGRGQPSCSAWAAAVACPAGAASPTATAGGAESAERPRRRLALCINHSLVLRVAWQLYQLSSALSR